MSSSSRELSPRRPAAAAELFQRLWDEVADLVGTAATAALLRRALKRASAKEPELAALVLRREGVEHLRRLVRDDLHPLFRELTGPVIARRLAQAPDLVEAGLASEEANHEVAAGKGTS